MLRIDKREKKLVSLTKSALADADHCERHLQSMICTDPDPFCDEIGEKLWVIGQEVRPSEALPDRIDILALDENGSAVVIELKRGTHKLQLLQAIAYAGMVSRWTADRFVEALGSSYQQSKDDARAAIESHTGSEITAINSAQRILLIAEDFDPSVLVSAEWLHENFGVDIRCYRLQLSQEGTNDYLTCTCIYPPLEIASLSRSPEGSTGPRPDAWTDWPSALKAVENSAVRQFFESELSHNQENRLRYRELIYRIDDKRRYWVACRLEYAYVWQRGRFEGDEDYWKKIVSKPQSVGQRQRSLRFNLVSPADFSAFRKALQTDLKSTEFSDDSEGEQPSDD